MYFRHDVHVECNTYVNVTQICNISTGSSGNLNDNKHYAVHKSKLNTLLET